MRSPQRFSILGAGAKTCLVLPTALVLAAGLAQSPAHAAGKALHWTRAYKANPGFSVEYPAGWTVGKQGGDILVQSPDKTSLVIVAPFASASGESAQTHVGKFVSSHGALLPKAHVDRVTLQGGNANVALGAVSYVKGKAGQAWVLCSLSANGGMVYAMAAPSSRFDADRPTLMRVLQSLRFGPPPGAQKVSAAKGSAKTNSLGLKFVKWTDPKEKAFSVDVPAGWKVLGGLNRLAPCHTNMSVTLLSPDQKMLVRFGDPSLPMLQDPDPMQMQIYGIGEGQPYNPTGNYINMFLHFMPASEFGPWYMKTAFSSALDDFSVTHQDDYSKTPMASAILRGLQQSMPIPGVKIEVTAADSEFKATDKTSHQPIVGVIVVVVDHMFSPIGGNGWGAPVIIVSGCADDNQVKQHQTILRAVISRITATWRTDPQWQQAENQRGAQATAQVQETTRQQLEMTKQRSAQIESNSDRLMDSYWKHVGAQDEQQRQQVNYFSDSTDVAGGGTTVHVGSGYSNYYLDPRTNSVVGTNSQVAQPNLTPLSQF